MGAGMQTRKLHPVIPPSCPLGSCHPNQDNPVGAEAPHAGSTGSQPRPASRREIRGPIAWKFIRMVDAVVVMLLYGIAISIDAVSGMLDELVERCLGIPN